MLFEKVAGQFARSSAALYLADSGLSLKSDHIVTPAALLGQHVLAT